MRHNPYDEDVLPDVKTLRPRTSSDGGTSREASDAPPVAVRPRKATIFMEDVPPTISHANDIRGALPFHAHLADVRVRRVRGDGGRVVAFADYDGEDTAREALATLRRSPLCHVGGVRVHLCGRKRL